MQRLLGLILVTLSLTACKKDTPAGPSRDDHLTLGNPSGAGTADENNYLLEKPQYVLSYNRHRGTANWVSWHLSAAWRGNAARSNSFRTDDQLPAGWDRVASSDYTNSGFDRGHLCPSDDRDGSEADNTATFLMTNIIPQAPDNNQITWKALEDYCRKVVAGGNEIYLIAGAYGQGGSGENGGTTNTLAGGKVIVPSRLWKVAVILPVGEQDLGRINESTRVIAVDLPNRQSVDNEPWGYYRTSVDAIEAATGYDLLSRLPLGLQTALESRPDTGPIQ